MLLKSKVQKSLAVKKNDCFFLQCSQWLNQWSELSPPPLHAHSASTLLTATSCLALGGFQDTFTSSILLAF